MGKKKIFCVPLCAELHEGVEELRKLQNKKAPILNGEHKTSVTTLMAAMASDFAAAFGVNCLLVLDAYFAVGPVFLLLRQTTDAAGERLVHIVTRAKSNAVAYEDPPPPTGRPGRPRKYGTKLKLSKLFDDFSERFQQIEIDLYGKCKTVSFLCLDLIWKPVGQKVRFVLICDGDAHFMLMCSDLALPAPDIIRAYSYRFKIEVNFKVLKHLTGVFFYHFWTAACPRLSRKKRIDLGKITDSESKRLVRQTADAIEGFVNMGCIATGILQILSMN
ncbi:MAG: transposase, partial [Planctomycetaceae bacterium]|nr:transposase [Planctomycetaceae bacterium]